MLRRRYEILLPLKSIDVEDSPETRQFFSQFKQKLLERFKQIEIYIASFPIDIL
jgi:hypothetical protein